MVKCRMCGKEYSIICLERCPNCKSKIGDKILDITNEVGDLIGL